jgi:predicted dehydrogenase
MSGSFDRRQFLGTTAAAGFGFWVAGGLTADESKTKLNVEKLTFACIGILGKGDSDASQVANLGNVIAICDIDEKRLEEKANKVDKRAKDKTPRFRNAQKFTDFRELFAKLGDKIDAVVVSTPDHTHAVASVMAMRAGKHVYCQKPLTWSIQEARTMREIARQFKVCTQMGNQGTATDGLRSSVELLRSGGLGTVTEVHIWTDRPAKYWKQSPDVTKRPEPKPVPKHVHWDLFLGPAPERPYAPGYHPFAWRGWRDFGTGAMGDMACHIANMPFMGLELGYPTSIAAESETPNPETYPGWAKVTFQFPAKGKRGPLKLTWYEGSKDGKLVLPPIELLQGKHKKFSSGGSLIVAERATLYSRDDYGNNRELIGKDAGDVKQPEKTLPRRGGGNDQQQKSEWVEAINKKDPKIALSNFDYASMLTEVMLLGNIAVLAGKKLEYDGETGKFTNASEANKYLGREYRPGWKL